MRVPRAPATTNILSQPTTCATTIALLSGTKHHRLNNSIQSLPLVDIFLWGPRLVRDFVFVVPLEVQ